MKVKLSGTREDLLAYVAELYYLANKSQAEIADEIGLTRSMISKMLSEAREIGLVEINVHRPISYDIEAGQAIQDNFQLEQVLAVLQHTDQDLHHLERLGKAAAQLLEKILFPGSLLGLVWGTSTAATVDAIRTMPHLKELGVNVIQLVGALGSRSYAYTGFELVRSASRSLGGQAFYMNAPFYLKDLETVRSLMENPNIHDTMSLVRHCNYALLGVGSLEPDLASFYQAGDMPLNDLQQIQEAGGVGSICGLHFDIHGNRVAKEISKRSVTIGGNDLMRIPIRIGVAGGAGKVRPIIGALRGGYLTHLVTDSLTAKRILAER